MRRWPFALLLLLSLVALVYCGAGVMMAGSFSASTPEQLDHWRRVAYVYLGLCALSLVGIVAAVVALVRRSRGRAARLRAAD